MSIFDELFHDVALPSFCDVTYALGQGAMKCDEILQQLDHDVGGLLGRIAPGSSVALAVGSREIKNLAPIVRHLAHMLAEAGANPFIIPAMGSHGGATAQGQSAILAGFGVTAQSMGVPVKASMDTVSLGRTEGGLPVYFDACAAQADHVIPIGRIKPHTDFRGRYESGLVKMLAIGCGKQRGASLCHAQGFPRMSGNIEQIARVILKKKRIPFGIAIIENGTHDTFLIKAIPGERILDEEPALLEKAKTLIPALPFEKVDVLILDQIGKEISGSGMDPNVTGRSGMLGRQAPFIERIVVLDLSNGSHNNGAGIGNADVTTQRFYQKFSFECSYPNGITSRDPGSLKLPAIMPNDLNAIQMGIFTATGFDPEQGMRICWLHDTLSLSHFRISQALAREAGKNPRLNVGESIWRPVFGCDGNLQSE